MELSITRIETEIQDAKEDLGVLIHEVITLRNERNSLVDEIKAKKKELEELEKDFTKLFLKSL